MSNASPSTNRERPVDLDTVGTVNAPTTGSIIPKECGTGAVRQTVLTFTNVPVTVANTTGASFGSFKFYDFPEGLIHVHGVSAYFSSIVWTGESIVATGSGDFSMGTTATADATLSSTDVNLLPSSAMLDPFVGGVGRSNAHAYLAASAKFDGTTTPVDAYLNVIIDDADVSDTDSDTVLFTGTVVITWQNEGNPV